LYKERFPKLKIHEKEIKSDDVKWNLEGIKPDHPLFKVDHSRSALNKNDGTFELVMPVFSDEELLPFSKMDTKKKVEYDGISNFVNYTVEYQRGHLVKVIHQFGFRGLKRSEELYLDQIIEEEVAYHFRYDFDKKIWKYVEDEEAWRDMKGEIEEYRMSSDAVRIAKTFFNELYDLKGPFDDGKIEAITAAALEFFEFQNIMGEVDNEHLELLKESINSLLSVSRGVHFQADAKLTAEKIYRPKYTGYWVKNDEIYPNAAEFLALRQKATDNRNSNTKRELKKALLAHHEKSGKTFILLSDPLFKNTQEELKRKPE
jgi:hypothetical protein